MSVQRAETRPTVELAGVAVTAIQDGERAAHHPAIAGDRGAVMGVTMPRGTWFIPGEGDPRVPARGV